MNEHIHTQTSESKRHEFHSLQRAGGRCGGETRPQLANADEAESAGGAPYISREYLLATLRAATFQCRLAQAEIEVMGMAVSAGDMSPEAAFATLEARGALAYLSSEAAA